MRVMIPFSSHDLLLPLSRINIHYVYLAKTESLSSEAALSRVVPGRGCSKNMQQIYRRTTMPKCDFNKYAKQLY